MPSALLASPVVVEDSTIVDIREFDENDIEAYRESGDYIYDRQPPPPDSELEKLIDWLIDSLNDIFDIGNETFGFSWMRILIILGAIVAVIWVVLKINPSFILRRGKSDQYLLNYETAEENIHEIDFDNLIEKAIQSQLYRKAIRLYYLKSLKSLADKGLINWVINKTNRQYVFELQDSSLKVEFSEITHFFNHIWYGDFALDVKSFKKFQEKMLHFQARINSVEA